MPAGPQFLPGEVLPCSDYPPLSLKETAKGEAKDEQTARSKLMACSPDSCLSLSHPCQAPEFPSNWCALEKAFVGEKILHYLQSALHLRARSSAQRAPAHGSKDGETPEPCTGVQNEHNYISILKCFCLLDGCRQEGMTTKLCATTMGAQTVVAAGRHLPHHCGSYKSCCSTCAPTSQDVEPPIY